MSKPRAIPLAAQVEAAVERAERAETYAAALKKQVGDLTRAHQKDMARIKELEGPQTAPPPDKPECLLYGKPATIKAIFELYEAEAKARKKLEADLSDMALKLDWAKGDLAFKDQLLADVRRRRDLLQAEAEALRKFVPKAGSVVETHDAKEAKAYFLAIAAMLGAALGALVGGLLL